MKRFLLIQIVLLTAAITAHADNKLPFVPIHEPVKAPYQVINGDTVPLFFLHDVYVFPNRFKNKRQERFFWRTVRDVKKCLPYAKLIAKEVDRTNTKLEALKTDKERRQYMKEYEKGLFKKYEPAMRHMTARQGQLLMKLVDRETDKTSYEVIRLYKGSFVAGFWQGIARIFGNNLKLGYDAEGDDKITERVIILVENGQL